jgi:hypothetical protein
VRKEKKEKKNVNTLQRGMGGFIDLYKADGLKFVAAFSNSNA